MQDAVYYYAVQFLLVCCAYHLAVAANGVERDEKVAADNILLAVVEGDDVGVVVVLQILAVNLKNLLVVAEDIIKVAYGVVVLGCYGTNLALYRWVVECRQVYIFR